MSVTPLLYAEVTSFPNLHTPFLERASRPGNRERSHALGAFLTLRAVDRVAENGVIDGLAYQLRACANYLEQLHPSTNEVSHLRDIVRVAQEVLRVGSRVLMWAPLLAFAFWLENEMRLDEALDVLETSLRFGDGLSAEETAARLQLARVLKLAGRFVESLRAYDQAAAMASGRGDWRSEMVSKIGRAEVKRKTGDLRHAERELRYVLSVARKRPDQFIEARALHDLAVVAFHADRATEAVPLAFRAFELYDDAHQRGRALNDVGMFLKGLGHYTAAKEAFLLVLRDEIGERQAKTELELLELASLVQDRLGFERWRRELNAKSERLLPEDRVDFEIKLGIGLAGFESPDEALFRLNQGVAIAEKYGFGQRVFEAERLIAEIKEGNSVVTKTMSPSLETTSTAPEFQDAIDALYALSSGST